jgi:GH24 family phage-related lysozyme (muramidase)
LPRYAKSTRATYPGVEDLPADAQGMLLSLIYNRGTKLTGPARTEMAAIRPLVAGGVENLDAIADQFESMVRLWPDLPGLQKRRRREAELIRESDRTYRADELIRI